MSMSDDAFRAFDHRVRSDPVSSLRVTWNAARFAAPFGPGDGVVQVIPTGSVVRGTSTGQISDFDVIFVLDHKPASVQGALDEMRDRITRKHGVGQGTHSGMVKGTELDNQVVTCHLDAGGPYLDFLGSSPTIEVLPAYREGAHLVIPELSDPDWGHAHWMRTDPEQHNAIIAERQMFWTHFDATTHATKTWSEVAGLDLQGVAVELLVLKHMPRPRWFTSLSRGETIAKFFESAARHGVHELTSPIGFFGVQALKPPPNYAKLSKELKEGAELSRRALEAERLWSDRRDIDGAVVHPSRYWNELLGPKYRVDWMAEFIESIRRWWQTRDNLGERTLVDPTVLHGHRPESALRHEVPLAHAAEAAREQPASVSSWTSSWTQTPHAKSAAARDPAARYEAPVAHGAARVMRQEPTRVTRAEPTVAPEDPLGSAARAGEETIFDRVQPQPPRKLVVFGRAAR